MHRKTAKNAQVFNIFQATAYSSLYFFTIFQSYIFFNLLIIQILKGTIYIFSVRSWRLIRDPWDTTQSLYSLWTPVMIRRSLGINPNKLSHDHGFRKQVKSQPEVDRKIEMQIDSKIIFTLVYFYWWSIIVWRSILSIIRQLGPKKITGWFN